MTFKFDLASHDFDWIVNARTFTFKDKQNQVNGAGDDLNADGQASKNRC